MKIIATVLLAAGVLVGANHTLATANVRVAAAATRHQANPMGLFFNTASATSSCTSAPAQC
jgi:hypothetical protein